MYGTSQGNLHKLQRIQNTFAKLVSPGHTHSSYALKFLHWLPVRQRIYFKMATLTFKLLNFDSPNYLACLLKPYLPVCALRSHGQRLLAKPRVKTCIGSRAFRVAAPSDSFRLGSLGHYDHYDHYDHYAHPDIMLTRTLCSPGHYAHPDIMLTRTLCSPGHYAHPDIMLTRTLCSPGHYAHPDIMLTRTLCSLGHYDHYYDHGHYDLGVCFKSSSLLLLLLFSLELFTPSCQILSLY